ncbi:hypothetical protein D9758_000548 [Tetrapyrgos nigripes]|uniref:FAD/NAD(P)-binding domain-containing protein n=1 Tax=Tetrapyrgos nigripes TaxID=182062 RepID=A0A8H5H262_9AGAR|nr:hypothetical protein D9758_000548 [Tetrapyrgos nigripes]
MWNPFLLLFQLFQWLLDKILSPDPPPPNANLRRPRIAIIGAGLTGVSAASHCVGHGFESMIFEAGGRERLGVRKSATTVFILADNDILASGLQIHSITYRFFPKLQWKEGYPKREEIVDAVEKLWKTYHLEDKTKFNTKVEKVWQESDDKWYVNSEEYGKFDGVIAAIGTCGDPKTPHMRGQESFEGTICHSSELGDIDGKGKKIVIIGGGASAVEALEYASVVNAAKTTVLARSDKWIIPRNALVDMLLAMNIFGQELYLAWIPEFLLKRFFYRDLSDLAPSKGLFTETPMVNSEVLDKIREGTASWLRGDIISFDKTGVNFNQRSKGVPAGGPGKEIHVDADIIIMATGQWPALSYSGLDVDLGSIGFYRPSLKFLPEECFEEPFNPPNWYLQTFPPPHRSICANNCTYVNGIGAVGNYHIGIYTRILLMFLVDPTTRPNPSLMRLWINFTRFLKARSPTPAFDFFTYTELLWWLFFCVVINPFRWKWALFVFCGIGVHLPLAVVKSEDNLREVIGMEEYNSTIWKRKHQ